MTTSSLQITGGGHPPATRASGSAGFQPALPGILPGSGDAARTRGGESHNIGRAAAKQDASPSRLEACATQGPRLCQRTLVLLLTLLFPILSCHAEAPSRPSRPSLLLLAGAGGSDQYATVFADAAKLWEKAAAAGRVQATAFGLDPAQTNPRDAFREALQREATGTGDLWLVLLGHGTFDGREARFNARGDDFTAAELAEWLKPIKRPIIVVAAFSCSGAFLKPLSAPGRVVVSATRTGSEENYSRFAKYISGSIADPAADLDQDGQTSLLEAWLTAAQRVAGFYKDEGRLATEHSIMDDNGDGFGTPADWFKGLRAVKQPQGKGVPDGARARQIHLVPSTAENALSPSARAERDRLELELAALRERKAELPEDQYYRALEALLLQIAKIYEPARGS